MFLVAKFHKSESGFGLVCNGNNLPNPVFSSCLLILFFSDLKQMRMVSVKKLKRTGILLCKFKVCEMRFTLVL